MRRSGGRIGLGRQVIRHKAGWKVALKHKIRPSRAARNQADKEAAPRQETTKRAVARHEEPRYRDEKRREHSANLVAILILPVPPSRVTAATASAQAKPVTDDDRRLTCRL